VIATSAPGPAVKINKQAAGGWAAKGLRVLAHGSRIQLMPCHGDRRMDVEKGCSQIPTMWRLRESRQGRQFKAMVPKAITKKQPLTRRENMWKR